VSSTNDVLVTTDGIIYTADRIHGGLHIFEME